MDQSLPANPAAHSVPPDPPIPRVIGLTGGVGMGKTTISDYLKNRYHLPILDADDYARLAVAPESPVLNQIVSRYGNNILLPTGALDRRRLGDIVFNNASERQWLEQQIHPDVRARMEAELRTLAAQKCQTVVLVIPLLFEARMTDLVTEIWVVYSANHQQVERLHQRDQLNLDQVRARIASQMPIAKKMAQADVLLDNSSSPEALFQQVEMALAHQPDRCKATDSR
jgi:dephospho-CoA kinase